MTAFTSRRSRHLKTAIAALAVYAAAATATAVYFMQTVRLPVTVTVSPGRGAASVPARHNGGSHPRAGQSAPSVPDISLSGVSWRSLQGYELPVSAQAGPRDTSGGLASGYADSPLGALLAAVNITARTSWQFGPSVFGPTVNSQVTGRFAAQVLAADQNSWGQGASESVAGTTGTRQVAFSFDEYAPTGASVDLVSAAPGAGDYAVTQVNLVWLRGDWRVVAPPGGDWANSATQVSTADGFTAFPGQGA